MLFADGQGDLGKQAAIFYGDHTANQLISPADFAVIRAARADIAALQRFGNESIDFGFRDAVMAAGSLRGFNLAVIDPLLQCGIADTENIRGFAGRQKSLHGHKDRRL